MRTIAVINQKGGCGKTTTAINLGAAFGRLGVRTLLIDLDPQGHCAAGLGVPESRIELDSLDLLQLGGRDVPDLGRMLWRAARNLDLIPSRIRLAGLEAPGAAFGREEHRERALARALGRLGDRFEVCLVDCPPSVGLLTFNALVASDLVLVPVETGFFSLQGAARQLTTVRALGRRLGKDLRCAVLPTLHESGLSVAEDLLDELQRRFGKKVLPVTIHRDAALREAASFGRPVCEHAPGSRGARDYAALASVLIESEHLEGSESQDDAERGWEAIEAASRSPVRRPQAPTRDTPPDPWTTGGFGPQPVIVHAPMAGDIVITLAGAQVSGELARRTADRPEVSHGSRAEEIARRAAAAKPPEPSAAVAAPGSRPCVRRSFGVSVGREGVLFAQPGALGRCVAVAGDFSGWKPISLDRCPETGTHELKLRLTAGRHEYRLIVDGHWIADPYNTEWVLNEFGEPHSIVEVAAGGAATALQDHRCGSD